MIETWQVLLISVVTVLTILLTVIGVQVVYILKEVRETVRKVNKIADDTAGITGGLSKSLTSIAGIGAFVKVGTSLLNLLKKKMDEYIPDNYSIKNNKNKDKNQENKKEEQEEDDDKELSAFRRAANRVFRKNGKPLV